MADQAYMPQVKSVEWETPDWLFEPLCHEFDFSVDAAASDDNAKLVRYWTREVDGLAQDWGGERLWINPPWDAKSLRAWTGRAWRESRLHGVISVMLVPVKSDQDWWHLFALRSEIRFILGRVAFNGANSSYPGPVAVLIFGPDMKPCVKTLIRTDR